MEAWIRISWGNLLITQTSGVHSLPPEVLIQEVWVGLGMCTLASVLRDSAMGGRTMAC